MIEVMCPKCDLYLQLPEDAVWKQCQCPTCQTAFWPDDAFSKPRRRIAKLTEHVTDVVPACSSHEEKADLQGERDRFLRELADANSGDDVGESYCWSQVLFGGKIGGGLGCLACVLTFAIDRSDICTPLWGIVGAGILGGCQGFLIGNIVYHSRVRHRTWVERTLLGLLVLWVLAFVFLMWPVSSPLFSLLGGVGTALPVVLLAGFGILSVVKR